MGRSYRNEQQHRGYRVSCSYARFTIQRPVPLTTAWPSAGVSGLTSALLLSKSKANKVTIVAKHMPGDYDIEYTSPYAGANVLPYVFALDDEVNAPGLRASQDGYCREQQV